MDRKRNPFAPGAGTRPPELAGREQVLENATVALARSKAGRSAKSQMLLGLRADVEHATATVLDALDQGFFRVRFDRLKPSEKNYVRAMAHLGAGPHRSGDIASLLGVKVTSVGPLRSGLIKKGMVYSPQHGDTAFTVPMFDEYMRRTMTEWRPK